MPIINTNIATRNRDRWDRIRERIRHLRLIDDDFMTKVFENIACAQLLLRIVLGRDDLIVQEVIAQRGLKNLQGRSLRLDIRAIDRDGVIYNVEVQRSDIGAHAKRARYHSALLDANITDPGEEFQNIGVTYVIFITENDVLGMGLPIYYIDRMINGTDRPFGDDAHIIYVNSQIQDPTTELGRLMHDFWCEDHRDMNNPILANEVRHYKEDEKGVYTMCKSIEELCKEFAAEDAAEAARNEQEATALTMLHDGERDYNKISRYSRLTIDEVQSLEATMNR